MSDEMTTTTIDDLTASSLIAPVYFGHATARVVMVRKRARPKGRRRAMWFAARRNRRGVPMFVDVPASPTPSMFWGPAQAA